MTYSSNVVTSIIRDSSVNVLCVFNPSHCHVSQRWEAVEFLFPSLLIHCWIQLYTLVWNILDEYLRSQYCVSYHKEIEPDYLSQDSGLSISCGNWFYDPIRGQSHAGGLVSHGKTGIAGPKFQFLELTWKMHTLNIDSIKPCKIHWGHCFECSCSGLFLT